MSTRPSKREAAVSHDVAECHPVLVEKVSNAVQLAVAAQMMRREGADFNAIAERAIHVVFDELGLKGEHREPPTGTSIRIHGQIRYVSDWISVDQLGRLVEQGDER